MNKEWSERNKKMQSLLKKATFPEGIAELLDLRKILMQEILTWKSFPKEIFSAIPYLNAEGYHSKTIAYSLWHIFRIEDIVVNSLIRREEQVLFAGDYGTKMGATIQTTGNELKGMEIAEFSKQLDIDVLYQYILAVKETTDAWLKTLEYADLKTTYSEADKAYLKSLDVVSEDEDAIWLIDYWCDKDLKGLLKMPLSRHWIMHIEAAKRIYQHTL